MKKLYLTIFILLASILLISCNNEKDNDKLVVISSFTIISDMVEQIGKDKVKSYNLVPTGTDPHEYEPLPNDLRNASRADILFYNGLNLEGGENGWFFRLVDATNQKKENVFNVSVGITPLYLTDQTNKEQINPHAFISPKNGLIMVDNILEALILKDQKNKEFYQTNANNYKQILISIDEQYDQQFLGITEDKRIIVTSERAFQYLANDYDIVEGYIWAIDTDETGTKEQINSLINFIRNNNINYLFLESNVDPRPMQTVSEETNIPIYSERVFADELTVKGTKVDTYEKFLTHNLRVFIGGITG